MGDKNQLFHINKIKEKLEAPYLEVGSKDYGNTQDLRSLFADGLFVGADMLAGPGVDVVLDFTHSFNEIDSALNGQRFSTIFCLSVLEHCSNPFTMAQNMTSLLKKGGTLVLSVPFAWKIHGYPNDYWRFTPEGIKVLFPMVEFDPELCIASTSIQNEFQQLDEDFGKIYFSLSRHKRQGRLFRGIIAKCFKGLSKLGLFSWFAGYSYLFAPTNIIMVGKKK